MDLVRRLADTVGTAHVLTEPGRKAAYESDWTRRWHANARAVVRPANADQVAECVAACAAAGVPLVPQGGNTGLVGGAVPVVDGVLLSLARLTRLGPVDHDTAQVTAGAGASLAAVQRHAGTAGYEFGVDLAARDSATVGGAVATNAGGERVLRHGPTRRHVIGLRAVLADGRTVGRLGGLVKDNVGYDLAQLMVGSEGTLGVVTEVRLRLVPARPARAVALVAVADTAEAVTVLSGLRHRLDTLEAAELFHARGLDLVRSTAGLRPPFPVDHPTYLLVECADRRDPGDELAGALAGLTPVRDAVLAVEPGDRHGLWAYRERHTEAIATRATATGGTVVKLDVAVPLPALPQAELDIAAAVTSTVPDAELVLFGHLAEGNLHVNVILPVPDATDAVSDAVLHAVATRGGSISAEHGVGRAKTRWTHLSREPAELAAMRAVKSALDPHGLLNPGVLFGPATPSGP